MARILLVIMMAGFVALEAAERRREGGARGNPTDAQIRDFLRNQQLGNQLDGLQRDADAARIDAERERLNSRETDLYKAMMDQITQQITAWEKQEPRPAIALSDARGSTQNTVTPLNPVDLNTLIAKLTGVTTGLNDAITIGTSYEEFQKKKTTDPGAKFEAITEVRPGEEVPAEEKVEGDPGKRRFQFVTANLDETRKKVAEVLVKDFTERSAQTLAGEMILDPATTAQPKKPAPPDANPLQVQLAAATEEAHPDGETGAQPGPQQDDPAKKKDPFVMAANDVNTFYKQLLTQAKQEKENLDKEREALDNQEPGDGQGGGTPGGGGPGGGNPNDMAKNDKGQGGGGGGAPGGGEGGGGGGGGGNYGTSGPQASIAGGPLAISNGNPDPSFNFPGFVAGERGLNASLDPQKGFKIPEFLKNAAQKVMTAMKPVMDKVKAAMRDIGESGAGNSIGLNPAPPEGGGGTAAQLAGAGLGSGGGGGAGGGFPNPEGAVYGSDGGAPNAEVAVAYAASGDAPASSDTGPKVKDGETNILNTVANREIATVKKESVKGEGAIFKMVTDTVKTQKLLKAIEENV